MKRKRIYLGVRAPDIGKKGLTSPLEVASIAQAILDDYWYSAIPYELARKRILFLKRIVRRNKRFPRNKIPEADRLIEEYLMKLDEMKKLKERINSPTLTGGDVSWLSEGSV